MDWILDRLACGSLADVRQSAAAGMFTPAAAIVSLAEKDDVPWSYPVRYEHFLVSDEESWPLSTIEWLTQRVSRLLVMYDRVIVHCHGGVTRSPALCAAHLIRCGFSPGTALVHVQTRRPASLKIASNSVAGH